MAMYLPPANLKDFDRSTTQKDALYQAWHTTIQNYMAADSQTPAFFDVLHPPLPDSPGVAAIPWTGLPGNAKRLNDGDTVQAAQLVEPPVAMGAPDPVFGAYTQAFTDAHTGAPFAGPQYRPQDEYLEWVSLKDNDGVISEVLFTCEGPEYWNTLAQDRTLLITLYKELLPDALKNQFQEQDLFFPQNVRWLDPNNPSGQPETFAAGTYNPYNRWNMAGAIHLTQPANTLGAEIALAQAASLLYGKPTPITMDPDLICCAGYGDVNRNSDPAIGSGANAQVRSGKRISLRNPIGLYMKSIDGSFFSTPDNNPIPAIDPYFVPLRQSVDGQMIVRARFKVPDGVTAANGKPLRVGDLLANGVPITSGGQIADAITLQLFALTLPGAPHQTGQVCVYRPCPNAQHPDYISPQPYNQPCPSGIGATRARTGGTARPASRRPGPDGQARRSRRLVLP